MRLFVGLAIPDDVARDLEERTREAASRWTGSARLVVAADLHVTLRFLGETAADRVPALVEAMEQVRCQAITVSLAGVGVFRGAGVVYADVQATPDLLRLQDALSEALAWRSVPRDTREFHPHVTLARRRHGIAPADLDRWNRSWSPVATSLTELVLFQSMTPPDGQGCRYQRLRTVELM